MIKKEKEVWRTYPDCPFIEASNLGRIRTKDRVVIRNNRRKQFIKGRVLKQRLRSDGYMDVHFSVKGKSIRLLVHRVIAISFLLNPNNLPEVNHKDNNRTNNNVSNLEWCTRQYNLDYKKKCGTSPAQIQGHPVFAVNLKTGKVLYFESQCETARQLGILQQDICKVIKGKYNQTGGYWFTENENEITEEKIQEIRAKMLFLGGVIAINLESLNVLRFESQREAERQLGVDHSSIAKVAKGKQNKAGGCWFCYADENVVEKTKEKFSNDIANKVEKLMKEHPQLAR